MHTCINTYKTTGTKEYLTTVCLFKISDIQFHIHVVK